MANMTAPVKLEVKDFKAETPPDWCPGCGDFGVLNVLQKACAEMGIQPHQLLVVSGIGCSSNLPGFFRSYGVHSLHGRALPFATGAKRHTGCESHLRLHQQLLTKRERIGKPCYLGKQIKGTVRFGNRNSRHPP